MDARDDFFDKSEYGNWRLTSDQYEYIADQLCGILGDNDALRYRMLLVELGEKKVTELLGVTFIYGGVPPRAAFFWDLIEAERTHS